MQQKTLQTNEDMLARVKISIKTDIKYINTYKDKIQRLFDEIKDVKVKLKCKEREHVCLKTMKSVEDEETREQMIRKKAEKIENLKLEIDKKTKELAEYPLHIIDALRQDLQKKTEKLHELTRKVSNLECEIQRRKDENYSMKQEYEDKLKTAENTSDSHNYTQLQEEVAKKTEALATITHQKQEFQAKIEAFKQEIEEKEVEIVRLKEELSSLPNNTLSFREKEYTQLMELPREILEINVRMTDTERKESQLWTKELAVQANVKTLQCKIVSQEQVIILTDSILFYYPLPHLHLHTHTTYTLTHIYTGRCPKMHSRRRRIE